MVLSGPQLAPRARLTLHRVMGVPPVMGTFLISIGVTKPTHWPSGEKNGWYGWVCELPVTSGVPTSWSSARTDMTRPASPSVTMIMRRPSGESSTEAPRLTKRGSSETLTSRRMRGSSSPPRGQYTAAAMRTTAMTPATAQGNNRLAADGGLATSSTGCSVLVGSARKRSMAIRASPIACRRWELSFSRHLSRRLRTRAGVDSGSCSHSGSRASTPARVSARVFPA